MCQVLVVDGDANLRKVMRANLELERYDVIEATAGDEGVNKARLAHPDLVILNVLLPDLDGPQAAAFLRQDAATTRIPILMIGALEEEEMVRRAPYADGYMAYPFELSEWLAAVGQLTAHN